MGNFRRMFLISAILSLSTLVGCGGPTYGIGVRNDSEVDVKEVVITIDGLKEPLEYGFLSKGIEKIQFENDLPPALTGKAMVSWHEGDKPYSVKVDLNKLLGGKRLTKDQDVLFHIEKDRTISVRVKD